MSTLVIVESPTKAKTIRNYLPKDYQVEASMGHIRDLPSSAEEIPAEYKQFDWARLGVNIDNNFEPIYVIPKGKNKTVQLLKQALKSADELILATDEDREGESISWHLLQLLKPKVPIKRMVFHEITKDAIQKALSNCRDIDENLVHAQETRRILDRLVGYTLSPLLWKKIAAGLSAGRVQSVAVRLLVQRERERRAFKEANYWDLKALLNHEKTDFEAKLNTLKGQKLANGSDFDPKTGKLLKGKKVVILNEQEAIALKERLKGKLWQVTDTEEKATTRKPSPPFTTSTLQQEANRKLGLGAKDTMRIAQSLYENGYITYMRTDSVHLSDQAIAAARSCVEQMYGKEYLSPQPRQYKTKAKGAQEAHEAIRPAGSTFRIPKETGLRDKELALYDLIWKRTVASQMAEAKLTQISVNIAVEDAIFRSSGKRIDFAGFFRAYVEGSDDPEAALENQEVILPNLQIGDKPKCKQLDVVDHQTQPPARYTEASLVKTLESEGVGRPSTYASIIGTIVDRGYAQLRNKALIPTFTAFAVISLLEKNFAELVDTKFTSKMEQSLDDIASGNEKWLPYLDKFYRGENGLQNQVKVRETDIDPQTAKAIELENLDVTVKIGKFGAYFEANYGEGVVKSSIPADLTPSDLDPKQIELLLKQKVEGPPILGIHPETQEPIYLLIGTYGPYVQLGDTPQGKAKKPKTASFPKGINAEDITLEMAVGYLTLPRTLGEHPDTGKPIKTSLGRFGAYVVHDQGTEGKDYRSLKKEDDVLTISLDRALELLAQPKATRGRRGATTKAPLKELGLHPDDNEAINIYQGPYGVYFKHGKTNVKLPEGETVESMNLDKALLLLKDKTPAKKATTTKKTTTKKTTTAKKNTAKRTTTTRKTTAKKTAE
jgi:DNA topoisomerase I